MELVLVGRSNVGKSLLIRRLTGLRVRVGRKPGVTKRIARYRLNGLEVVDLPGFGFMSRIPRRVQERAKTAIVHYLERHREQIIVAIEVVDARAFLEIADRWARRGQIPVDVEFFHFLRELELEPIVAVNKIDLIYLNERDEILDGICERLGLLPPWRQWLDTIVPLSARTGEGLKHLRELIDKRFRQKHLGRLMRFIKG